MVVAIESGINNVVATKFQAHAPPDEITVYRNWTNRDSFLAGVSKVTLSGAQEANIYGDTNFYDLESQVAGKTINFEENK